MTLWLYTLFFCRLRNPQHVRGYILNRDKDFLDCGQVYPAARSGVLVYIYKLNSSLVILQRAIINQEYVSGRVETYTWANQEEAAVGMPSPLHQMAARNAFHWMFHIAEGYLLLLPPLHAVLLVFWRLFFGYSVAAQPAMSSTSDEKNEYASKRCIYFVPG